MVDMEDTRLTLAEEFARDTPVHIMWHYEKISAR
jgi:hypothetical protein